MRRSLRLFHKSRSEFRTVCTVPSQKIISGEKYAPIPSQKISCRMVCTDSFTKITNAEQYASIPSQKITNAGKYASIPSQKITNAEKYASMSSQKIITAEEYGSILAKNAKCRVCIDSFTKNNRALYASIPSQKSQVPNGMHRFFKNPSAGYVHRLVHKNHKCRIVCTIPPKKILSAE